MLVSTVDRADWSTVCGWYKVNRLVSIMGLGVVDSANTLYVQPLTENLERKHPGWHSLVLSDASAQVVMPVFYFYRETTTTQARSLLERLITKRNSKQLIIVDNTN